MVRMLPSNHIVLIGAFLAMLAGCGRIGPGAADRSGTWLSGSGGGGGGGGGAGGSSSGGSSGSSSEPSKPVYDDKYCSNMTGEGGAKVQAACRAGK